MSQSSKNRIVVLVTKKVALIFAGPLSMKSGFSMQKLGKGILFKGDTKAYKNYLTLIGKWNAKHQGWILGPNRGKDIKGMFPNVDIIKTPLATELTSSSDSDEDEDFDF